MLDAPRCICAACESTLPVTASAGGRPCCIAACDSAANVAACALCGEPDACESLDPVPGLASSGMGGAAAVLIVSAAWLRETERERKRCSMLG